MITPNKSIQLNFKRIGPSGPSFWIIFFIFNLACSDREENKFANNWISQQDKEVQAAIQNPQKAKATDYADIINALGEDPYGAKLNSIEINLVTTEFGPTKIDMGQLPFQTENQEADIRPWSAWWYPSFEDDLFRSRNNVLSPLEKYDIFRQKYYARTNGQVLSDNAVEIAQRKFQPSPNRWEGLCNAWALASISTPEPFQPGKLFINNNFVEFSVSDLKALTILLFEAVPDEELKYYGQKFTGDQDGWIYPDLFPDQLHRLVEEYIFNRKQPFIIDYDPGVEIWNVPVYKAAYKLDAIPQNENAVLVRLWLFSADPFPKTEGGKVGTNTVIREYHYVLFGKREGTQLTVESGIWIKGPNNVDSRKDHPDYAIAIPENSILTQKSFNPAIEAVIVNYILERSHEND